MAISLIKEFKQKQKISLTPALKKSIDLLQLSRFELIQKIDKEIEVNPFVENEEYEEDDFEELSDLNIDDFDFSLEAKATLNENLINQIDDLSLSKQDYEICLVLINSLDESGHLVEDLSEIENILNFKYSFTDLENALTNIIQKLSPSGIGYRNFKECIQIQIDNKQLPSNIKEISKLILTENINADMQGIEQYLINNGYIKNDIEHAIKEIKSCDLSPGLNFEKIKFIEPDLKISVNNNNFNVEFIQESFPIIKTDDVLINKVKEEIKLKNNNGILQKINDAKWLLTSVKKRNDTIKSVGEYICSKQVAFFDNNPLKINSLSNKEIAKELRIHPSTVSRILRYKYIETPKGIIPLKSLLVSSVSRIRDISALQLMKLIKDTIKSEKKPKSDKKIAIELNKKGFGLARRTIAKYRKLNNIPSSRYR